MIPRIIVVPPCIGKRLVKAKKIPFARSETPPDHGLGNVVPALRYAFHRGGHYQIGLRCATEQTGDGGWAHSPG